jgi:hypothetical protein
LWARCLACSIFFFSPHYLINGIILVKMLLNIKCAFWCSLQLLSETFLILRRIERDRIKNVYWSSCKVPVVIVRCWWNLKFLDRFSKNTEFSIRAHRQTRRTSRNSVVAFRNYSNPPPPLQKRERHIARTAPTYGQSEWNMRVAYCLTQQHWTEVALRVHTVFTWNMSSLYRSFHSSTCSIRNM